MYDNGFPTGELGAGRDPWVPKERERSFSHSHRSLTSQLRQRLEGLSGLLGGVKDWLVFHTAAFPVIWVGAKVSLGRDRKQFVMYKFNK